MATQTSVEIPRPESGDVVEMILEDHRLFEHLLRELRNEQNDRDVLRRQMAELLVAHGKAEESKVHPQLERKDAIDEEERDILNSAREDVTEADRAKRALVDDA